MLSTVHLQTFLAVAEAGNYTAAGRQLNLTQPAVSQHIHALEEQLDHVKLFRRVGQRMVPTSAGEELLATAREMMALAARAEDTIKAMKGQVAGRVALGCTPSSGEHLLPPLLAAFHERFPGVALTVSVAPLDLLLEGLNTHQLQILLAEEAQRRRGWELQQVGVEPLVLVLPREHALYAQGIVSATDLRGKSLILPRHSSPARRLIEETLRRRGLPGSELQIALETDSVSLMLVGVQSGLGFAFVPQSCVQKNGSLASIEISGVTLQQEWYVLRSRERGAPRAVQELFRFLGSEEAQQILERDGLLPAPGSRPGEARTLSTNESVVVGG